MRHQLYREQQLNCDIETAWHFFSSPVNLSKITPEDMRFEIISTDDHQDIFEGMIINYIVSPMFKIPLKWRTRISQVELNKSFTDFQERGPYKYWSHFHEFIPNSNGILVKDTIDYELPFGILGNIAHRIFVRKKLTDIFNFRYVVLEKMFNAKK
ncbi:MULTISPECIES: SRPBCC family protein [Sphingobacterium]|jgi:ligand-binding SRPBCC domain-containing protein|uniref:SRPBCC family protein n=1 Tax=Sphingobacterium TaxID=28453 RepID=UPI00104C4335|nr:MULTISPECIES: SRPBCC family protein [Sphingobacterium]MCW2263944.1 ligand-binding SRPBCC domain-containing protein [Sphingobacterium kitahiroshimense]NJI73324.1 SRPBCC family protein [Sphingobacterium sp. B16(2022)]TCR01694.1 ligand-binding SRPBCC domain-containing protein [Sphingobacterium sp. JUb78]